MYLSQIRVVDPPHYKLQNAGLDWLAQAYSRYQDEQSFSAAAYRKLLDRVGCGEERISKRYFFLEDFDKIPQDSLIFKVQTPGGALDRQLYFQDVSTKIFSELYAEREAPTHLIHVTCTGYVSPSGAQLIAAEKFPETMVTHSYHMGCSGAFPALRMASGFIKSTELPRHGLRSPASVDIVHTELCTLHMTPTDPTLEQMVIHSLFADGVAAYRVTEAPPAEAHLEVLALGEFLLPDSANAMQWIVADKGMAMTLSKDVPTMIGAALRERLLRWESQTGFSILAQLPKTIIAVHPGGPKILDAVKGLLDLDESQVRQSREVLFERGNMSSATVPHIWDKILRTPEIADGTPVLSIAFGPGLTLCLSLMRVHR